MIAARALFAGPGAGRALIDGRDGTVEYVLSRGAYVRLGSEWLLVTGVSAPFGPLSLTVDGVHQLDLTPGSPAQVSAGRLVLGDVTVSLERMRQRCTTANGSRASLPAIRAAATAAQGSYPAAPARLRPGIEALGAARVDDGVQLLAGLGAGLTPAGDDVLAGYAAARFALGSPVTPSSRAAGRSSSLGLAYLRCAERGELPDAAARLLAAICQGSVAGAQAAIPSLRAWGSSSGIALAWGINAALSHLTERVELRGVRDARIPVGDLRVQGRGDRRFRRAPRRLVGGAAV